MAIKCLRVAVKVCMSGSTIILICVGGREAGGVVTRRTLWATAAGGRHGPTGLSRRRPSRCPANETYALSLSTDYFSLMFNPLSILKSNMRGQPWVYRGCY